jgi:hypothetical protein
MNTVNIASELCQLDLGLCAWQVAAIGIGAGEQS